MVARPRAPLAVTAFALAALAAAPAAASQSLDCTLGAHKTLSCWDGKITLRVAKIVAPSLLKAAPPDARTVFLSLGRACSPTSTGALECWGANKDGELGDGTRADHASPRRVRDLDDVTQVAFGNSTTCAVRGSGKVACWGYDDVVRARRLRPSVIPSLDHAVEIVAGSEHACARRRDGTVWCWGNNHYGQLGDGTQKDRRRPVQVAGLKDAVELTTGLSHVCARKLDGTVWCWGNGWGGTDGTDDALLVPARVPAIHGATAIVSTQTTESGILALQKDGRVVACHYQVRANERESSPRILCKTDRTIDARLLEGTQLTLHRPPPPSTRVASAARATIPRARRRPAKLRRP